LFHAPNRETGLKMLNGPIWNPIRQESGPSFADYALWYVFRQDYPETGMRHLREKQRVTEYTFNRGDNAVWAE